jgi:alpha/beta superfamily hydrolase
MQTKIVEERITFENEDGLQLVGVLAYPERTEPAHAVLLCSPHPHFAGNMDNNVICSVARELAVHSVTLRFDYRGIGDSQINLRDELSLFDYWSDMEQTKDYTDTVRDVTAAALALQSATGELHFPFSVVGYSFGAATGFLYGHEKEDVCSMIAIAPPLGKVSFEFLSDYSKPGLFLIGTGDFLYSEQKTEQLRQILTPNSTIDVLQNTDHFFRGEEEVLAHKVDEFICNNALFVSRRTPDAI